MLIGDRETITGRDAKPEGIIASVYGRSSIDFPDSVAHQWTLTRERAEADGCTVPESRAFLFGDNNASGKTSERPDFKRLERVILSGTAPFSRLYVKDKTRFGRWDNPYQHAIYEALFRKMGVEVVYCQDKNINFDDGLDDEDVGWAINDFINNIFSAKERARTVKRITEGMRDSVIDGSFPGPAPYGVERWYHHRSGDTEPVGSSRGKRPDGAVIKLRWLVAESATVRRIFDDVERGRSLQSISDNLNEEGLPGPGGTAWTVNNIRKIVRNPLYSGDLVWGRTTRHGQPVPHTRASAEGVEAILYQDFAPGAPVQREQFQRVQRILDGSREAWERRRATSPDYLLSGLVRCALCGESFHGHSRPPRKDGSRLRYYSHHQRQRTDCRGKRRNYEAEALEAAVSKAIMAILDTPDMQALTQRAIEDRIDSVRCTDAAERSTRLGREIRKLEEGSDQASENAALAESAEDRARHLRTSSNLAARAASLTEQLERLTGEEEVLRAAAKRQRASKRAQLPSSGIFSTSDQHTRKEILAALIARIEFDPDKEEAHLVVR
jgi:hypothetical protein